MSKTIQGFREKDYGMFIDLTDAMSSVSVDRKTGNLVLNEGAGQDRFNGALITSDFCHGFTLSAAPEGTWVMALRFGNQKSHVLGTTDDEAGAMQWLKKAWDVIRSHHTAEEPTEIENVSNIFIERLQTLDLTVRESEFMYWLFEGKNTPEIAQILGISQGTANKHFEHILRKLGVNSGHNAIQTLKERLGVFTPSATLQPSSRPSYNDQSSAKPK